jgi:hypothetical protein
LKVTSTGISGPLGTWLGTAADWAGRLPAAAAPDALLGAALEAVLGAAGAVVDGALAVVVDGALDAVVWPVAAEPVAVEALPVGAVVVLVVPAGLGEDDVAPAAAEGAVEAAGAVLRVVVVEPVAGALLELVLEVVLGEATAEVSPVGAVVELLMALTLSGPARFTTSETIVIHATRRPSRLRASPR